MSERIVFSQDEWRKRKRRAERNLRHAHAKGLMQGILSMLRPGDLVFDCGANLGEVCLPLAETGAEVHAFEPDPFAFEQLSHNVGARQNVILHNAAVGIRAGSIKLMRATNFADNPRGGSVKSTIVKGGRNINENERDTIDVAMLSLPDLLNETLAKHHHIALLKMDIEGAELDILEVMLERDLFEHIDLTVAETHESKFRDLRPRFRALRAAIAQRYPITKVNLDWI
ncbi:MAG: FkbM family methyltransferase [Pseudomonadota bacterium]